MTILKEWRGKKRDCTLSQHLYHFIMEGQTQEDPYQSVYPGHAQSRSPPTVMEAIYTHAYSQPPSPLPVVSNSFPSPGTPSPSPFLQTPNPVSRTNHIPLAAFNQLIYAQQMQASMYPSERTRRTPDVPEEVKKPNVRPSKASGSGAKKGKGARSGKNARGTDAETEKLLSEKAKEEADIVVPTDRATWSDDDTFKLVEYITEPDRFKQVGHSLKKICQDVRFLILLLN